MTRFEVILKDGKGSAFAMDAPPTMAAEYTLEALNDGKPFVAWATTLGTMLVVAKDQIAVIVVNAPERQAAPDRQAAPERPER